MKPLLTQGAGIPRAWTDDSHAEWDREARSYGPDDDDEVTPVETIVPWDPDGGDDDRRRADGLHLLHLTTREWEVIEEMERNRVPLEGVGSRCAWTPRRMPAWEVIGGVDVICRYSLVLGGTFIIFPGKE